MNKPRVGDPVYYKGEYAGSVTEVDGKIVSYKCVIGGYDSFIYVFSDTGKNTLFDWGNNVRKR